MSALLRILTLSSLLTVSQVCLIGCAGGSSNEESEAEFPETPDMDAVPEVTE